MSFNIWGTTGGDGGSSPVVVVPPPPLTGEGISGNNDLSNAWSSTWTTSSIQSAQPKVEEKKEEGTSWLWGWGGKKKEETNVTKPGFGWANRKTMCPKPNCTPTTHNSSHDTPVIKTSSSTDVDVDTADITPADTSVDDNSTGLFT